MVTSKSKLEKRIAFGLGKDGTFDDVDLNWVVEDVSIDQERGRRCEDGELGNKGWV